ncbi:MAG: T9SS C-terminal target domain-containing protein [Saprospirales bacterium]|nr:MAG: T9SS C-terminal target domain-containing protein [Saprospirales bacterium]
MMPMQAQDCVDIEEIKEQLNNLGTECNCSTTLILGTRGSTTNISTYQLGTLIQNECIQVLGTLVIDQITYFDNCDLIFDEGALIKVNDNVINVGFTDCTLQSCGDYYWDGIELGQYNIIFFRGNTMQHAFNGIHSTLAPVGCFITGNVFNNNHISINLVDDPENRYQRSQLTLNGNIFGKSEELKLHWELPPNFAHTQSTGVKADYAIVNSLVGNDPCSRTNIFVDLSKGYRLYNSVSQIESNLFHDFDDFLGYPPFAGEGIYTNISSQSMIGSSSLRQSGWPTNHIETFNYIDRPIVLNNSNVLIENNIIDNIGIQAIRNASPIGINTIRDNDIKYLGVGSYGAISVLYTYDNVVTNINNNNIQTLRRNHNRGIDVRSLATVTGARGQIKHNLINLDDFGTGITVSNMNHFNVSCNTVNIGGIWDGSDGAIGFGIVMVGGSHNRIAENSINGIYQILGQTDGWVNGIRIAQSQANTLRANFVNNTQYGFHFSNWNNNTFQYHNKLSDHDVGYYVGETGATGDQWYSANQWLGSYADYAAQNKGNPQHSKYHDYENLVTTTCWPGSISPDQGWFFDEQGTGGCGLPTITECFEEVEPKLSSLNYLDTLVARGKLKFDDFEDSRQWQAERYLLRNLIAFPGIVGGSGTLMDSFLNNAATTNLWEYHDLRTAIEYYSAMPGSLSDLWHGYYDEYLDLMDDAELAIDDWLTYPDSMELAKVISGVNEKIDSIWTLSSSAIQDWREESVDNLTGLLPQIASLPTPNLYASSEKLIMEATVRMAQGVDSLNSSMKNSLIQLAESCMLEYGPSVIDARGIVRLFDYTPVPLTLNCSESKGDRLGNPSESEPTFFEVFPNPTAGHFNLKFTSPIDQEGDVKLFDQTGKLVHASRINSSVNLMEISVDHLPAGQYTIKVNLNGKKDARSLIITR